jgi:hypothetical protein
MKTKRYRYKELRVQESKLLREYKIRLKKNRRGWYEENRAKLNFLRNPPKTKKLPWLDNYNAFLLSPYWKDQKSKFYLSHLKQCRACDSVKNLNLHHATYERMGVEREGDLVCLCKDCHKEVHKIQKATGRSLYQVTWEFIDDKVGIEVNLSWIK